MHEKKTDNYNLSLSVTGKLHVGRQTVDHNALHLFPVLKKLKSYSHRERGGEVSWGWRVDAAREKVRVVTVHKAGLKIPI